MAIAIAIIIIRWIFIFDDNFVLQVVLAASLELFDSLFAIGD